MAESNRKRSRRASPVEQVEGGWRIRGLRPTPGHVGTEAWLVGQAHRRLIAAAHAVGSDAPSDRSDRVNELVEAATEYHRAPQVPDGGWILVSLPGEDERRQAAAYHEAGHVVVGFVNGCRILGPITIGSMRSTSSIGNVHWTSRRRQRAEREAIVCYAGAAAEARRKPHAWPIGGYEDDFHRAEQKLILAGVEPVGAPWTALLARLQRQAAVLVNQGWPAIDALGILATSKDRIEAPEVIKVIEDTLPSALCALGKARGAALHSPTVRR